MDAAQRSLAHLRAADGAALRALVHLVVDEVLTVPPDVWLDDEVLARVGRRLANAARDPALRARLSAEVRSARGRLSGRARDVLPPGVVAGVSRGLALEVSPPEALTLRLLQLPGVHSFAREILGQALKRFAERARKVDALSGSLGSRALNKGKGLLGGLVGGLGDAVETTISSVREEIGRALDAKVAEATTSASDEAIRQAAAWIADPAHAPLLASLRVDWWERLLDTEVAELSEVELPVEALVDIACDAVVQVLDTDVQASIRGARAALAWLSATYPTLGDALDAAGLRDEARSALGELITPAALRLANQPAFAAWWTSLFA